MKASVTGLKLLHIFIWLSGPLETVVALTMKRLMSVLSDKLNYLYNIVMVKTK